MNKLAANLSYRSAMYPFSAMPRRRGPQVSPSLPVTFSGKKPTGSWLKKVSLSMLAAGSALMGVGINNQFARTMPTLPAPTQQYATTMTPPAPQGASPAQWTRADRSFRSEYTGSVTATLTGVTKDGHPVSGGYTILWEKDLFTLSQMDKEVQLRMLMAEMDPSVIKEEWTGETPSSFGPDIVEAYQQQLFAQKILPMMQERFARMTPQMPAEYIHVSPTDLMVGFEMDGSHLRDQLNDMGFTPKFMSFGNLTLHLPTGDQVLTTSKVVTESYEVTPKVEVKPTPPAYGNIPL